MRKKAAILITLCAAAGVILATVAMWFYYRNSMTDIMESAGSMQEYGRHFLFVCEEDTEMWQSIFENASETAAENDAVLEWVGVNAPVSYSLSQRMEISIASKPDGILLVPDGTEEIKNLTDRAADAGIPVVNLIRDTTDSRRVSFVGASNYQMGELYGEQIVKLLEPGENEVCLLTDSVNSSVASNLLYSQIANYLKNADTEGCRVSLYTKEADSRSNFEAEEVIRGILMSSRVPDILICVNSVQTECAETALVDYNMIGEVDVIGYYASQGILSALRRDLLPVTITCDAKQVGELSVTALAEYLDTGHVSDYFDITLTAVTNENVNRYVRSQHLPYTGGEAS